MSAMCVTLDPQTRKCNVYGTLWVAGIMLVEEGALVNWVEVEGRQLLVVGGERGEGAVCSAILAELGGCRTNLEILAPSVGWQAMYTQLLA